MRKYQSIWVQIKKTGTCTLVAHPKLHKRIKKAVTKEKWKDISYKIQWDIAGTEQPTLTVANDPENENTLIFTLIKPVLLTEL
jgi:hypothetical protein